MKILFLSVLLVLTSSLTAQPKKEIFAIDSLSSIMDTSKINLKSVKLKSRDIDQVEWRLFEIDTVNNRFVKATTQKENSKTLVTYYFYDGELIKVRKADALGVVKPQVFYFRDKRLIQQSSKPKSPPETLVLLKAASDLMAYVVFVRSRN